MKVITNNEHETIALGKKFTQTLKGGEVVLLIGNLGAGKTTFVQGVAQGLGIKKNITSPTFVLMKIYPVKNSKLKVKSLVHLDTYRNLNLRALGNIGALEYFGQKDTVCFVEWGALLEKFLQNQKIPYCKIKIHIADKNKRHLEIKRQTRRP